MSKNKVRVRRDDTVKVIAGKDKGTIAKVVRVLPDERRVVVDGVAKFKRHTRGQNDQPGSIVEKERSIDVSNVALWNETESRVVRVGYSVGEDGKKVRVDRKTGARIDA